MTSSCILSKPSVTVYVTELIIQVQVGLTEESSGIEGPWIYSLSRARSDWHKVGALVKDTKAMVLYRKSWSSNIWWECLMRLWIWAIDSITDGIFNSRYWLGKSQFFSAAMRSFCWWSKASIQPPTFPTSRKIKTTFVFFSVTSFSL